MNESIMLLHNALIGCKFNSLRLQNKTPIAVRHRNVSGSTPKRQNEHVLLSPTSFVEIITGC